MRIYFFVWCFNNDNTWYSSSHNYLVFSYVIYLRIDFVFDEAFSKGGRWPWLFFAAMMHGFVVEFMAYFAPFIENFWHAQGVITFFDRRMAIYIVFLCELLNNIEIEIYSI